MANMLFVKVFFLFLIFHWSLMFVEAFSQRTREIGLGYNLVMKHHLTENVSCTFCCCWVSTNIHGKSKMHKKFIFYYEQSLPLYRFYNWIRRSGQNQWSRSFILHVSRLYKHLSPLKMKFTIFRFLLLRDKSYTKQSDSRIEKYTYIN